MGISYYYYQIVHKVKKLKNKVIIKIKIQTNELKNTQKHIDIDESMGICLAKYVT